MNTSYLRGLASIAALFALPLLLLVRPVQAQNLVQNPGFEDNTGDPPTDWTSYNPTGGYNGAYAVNPHSGANSYVIGSKESDATLSQDIATVAGDS